MKRGRPVGSNVRQNMIEVLYFLKAAHGYHIYKVYKQIYPKITLRGIYYHLKKGLEIGEFEVAEVQREKGNYSWGSEAEKTYYKLGKKAKPRGDPMVKMYLESNPEAAKGK